jgi:hypothetical protein
MADAIPPRTTLLAFSGLDLDILIEGLGSSIAAHGDDFSSCIGASIDEAQAVLAKLKDWRKQTKDRPVDYAVSSFDVRLMRAALVEPHPPWAYKPAESPAVLGDKQPHLAAALAFRLGEASSLLRE